MYQYHIGLALSNSNYHRYEGLVHGWNHASNSSITDPDKGGSGGDFDPDDDERRTPRGPIN